MDLEETGDWFANWIYVQCYRSLMMVYDSLTFFFFGLFPSFNF